MGKMANYTMISDKVISVDIVKKLLKEIPSFNISDFIIHNPGRYNDKTTLAVYAVRNNDEELLHYLISENVDLNVRHPWSGTPLHVAASVQNFKLVKKLYESGADINSQLVDSSQTPLVKAVMNGNFEITKYLVDNGADVNIIIDDVFIRDAWTPILIAAMEGYDDIVDLLLKNNAEPFAKIKRSDFNVDSIKNILETSPAININSVFIVDGSSPFPLILHAVLEDNEKLLDYCIELNADVNISPPSLHGSVLDIAVCGNNSKIIEKLIMSGANVNGQTLKWCMPPLINAVCTSQYFYNSDDNNIVELLLKNNADPNIKSRKTGETPIMIACEFEKLEIMKTLFAYNATCDFRELLFQVKKHKNSQVLEYLLSLDVDAIDLNLTNAELTYSLLNRFFTEEKKTEEKFVKASNVEILLNAGFDINRVDHKQNLIVEIVESLNDRNGLLDLVKQHIVKLKQASLYVCQENIETVKKGYDDIRTECDREIEKLKSDKIGTSNQAFYGVLHKSIHLLAIRLRHTNIDEIVDKSKLLNEYPIYGGMIYYKLAKAQRRIELLKSVEESLDYVLNYCLKLPYTFTRELYMYLTNENLKKLKR